MSLKSTLMHKLATINWGSPWVFFAQVYGATWIFLVPLALTRHTMDNPLLLAAIGFSMIADEIIAVWTAYRLQGGAGVRDFFARAVDPRRISLRFYAFIFLSQPIATGLGLLTHLALGGAMPGLERPAAFLANPLSLLPFLGWTLLFGPIPEELGWRGWVLDRLQTRYNALASSLILGVVWGAWHLPLFFIPETYQSAQMGSFLSFVVGTVVYSVLMTWLYNNNARSTLSAILFHFMINGTGEFFAFPTVIKDYALMWNAVLALGLLLIWGPHRLSRRPATAEITWIIDAKRDGSKKTWKKIGNILQRFFDRGICPYQLASVLNFPLR